MTRKAQTQSTPEQTIKRIQGMLAELGGMERESDITDRRIYDASTKMLEQLMQRRDELRNHIEQAGVGADKAAEDEYMRVCADIHRAEETRQLAARDIAEVEKRQGR